MNEMLGQWLAYRDHLPFSWTLLDPDAPLPVPESNLRVLAAVTLLEERHQSTDPDAPLQAEIERLQQKVDVVMDLLGALLRHLQPLPPPCELRISREGLSWPVEAGAPSPGSQVLVRVHLHPCTPSPLQLVAEVLPPHEGQTCVRFVDPGELCTQALERHVFTRHRRSVAGARSPAARPVASGPA